MTDQEKTFRAWTLRELRRVGRIPKWFGDDRIMAAFGVVEITWPSTPARVEDRSVAHCRECDPECKRKTLVGCILCWENLPAPIPPIEFQIGIN